MRNAVLACVLAIAACSGQTDTNTGASSGLVGTPAPGSKFSRISLDMSKTQVQDIIGAPTDQNAHSTAKTLIPYYQGPGTTQINAHYKGEGVLTYDSRAPGSTAYQLTGIKVDPQEQGYVH